MSRKHPTTTRTGSQPRTPLATSPKPQASSEEQLAACGLQLVAARAVFHRDTHRIGTLYTAVKPVRGKVPVLFNGATTITMCMPERLQNL